MYPEIEPYEHGMLDVGDGNLVYWETCGNPAGKPALVLHGGPGAGCSPGMRRLFDPAAYRVVLFDQRQSGRSTPDAADFETDLASNTTPHLLADIEQLREHLGVQRWLLFGGSWGSTLGLAYAQRHPQRVSGIVLMGVTSSRRMEIDWLYHQVGRLFPQEWARFRDGVPAQDRDGNLVAAYHRLLNSPDPEVRAEAAEQWCRWETSLVSTDPDYKRGPRWSDPAFRYRFARIVTHYFVNDVWLPEGVLLREAGRLAGIPGVLVHGRWDYGGPLDTAWELARRWPDAELVTVSGAGHAATDPGMTEAVVAALDKFANG
ncbi:MAG TPA: prolyl aminopeptidase [Pseudonocardiaceae bacterium]|nr:prolyl aminopeptidase [Pseudonocardiaceae bacterium]